MSSLEQRLKAPIREQVSISPMVAALDIGASKITCFIGRSSNGPGPMRVYGVGARPSKGVRNGTIVDLESVERAILEVFHQAEEMAGAAVSEAVVSITGFGIRAEQVKASMTLPLGEIGIKERRRIVAMALGNKRFEGRTILHSTPAWFKLDGAIVKDPLSMIGRRLEVSVTIVTAPTAIWRNLVLCVERTNRHVAGVIAAPYAASLASLAEDELESGALLVEMGARSTTAALFQSGNLAHVDGVPIGSDHVTQDIAHCFGTSASAAEKLKIVHGSAIANLNEEEQMIDAPRFNEDGKLVASLTPKSLLTGIVRPRVEETLELLRDRLNASGIENGGYGRRIILTGGGAQLNGVRELAARVFESHVRVGRPQRFVGLGDAVSGPGFAVCAGLLKWGIERPIDLTKIAKQQESELFNHPLTRAVGWLKEIFW
jgi:cell division protein FtsA